MKRFDLKYLFVFTLLLTAFSFGQNRQPKSVGVGLVKLNKPNDFRDYKMPTGLFLDLAETKICTSNEIMPFYAVPEVGIYNFVCLEVLGTKYKVLINDTEVGYLPKNETYSFDAWEDIIIKKGVGRLTDDNPVRSSPSTDSEEINYSCKFDNFKVDELLEKNGEFWVHVSFWSDCKERKDIVSLMTTGYIKWRTADELLVTVFMGC